MPPVYKHFYRIAFCLLLLPLIGIGQVLPSAPVWVNDIGGQGSSCTTRAVKIDPSTGATYVCGIFTGTVDLDPSSGTTALTSAGNYDGFVAKYRSDGSLIWARSFGGAGSDDPYHMAIHVNGNVTVAGRFWGTMDADPGPDVYNLVNTTGQDDAFVINIDYNGNFLWAKSVEGTDNNAAQEIAIDRRSSRITAGWFRSNAQVGNKSYTNTGGLTGLLVKYDESGNVLSSMTLGTTGDNTIHSIQTDDQSNVVICGSFSGLVNFNPNGTAYNLTSTAGVVSSYVAKYTQGVQLLWVQIISGNTWSNVSIDPVSNNIYITGSFVLPAVTFAPGQTINAGGTRDIFIAKYAPDGAFQWANAIGGSGTSVDVLDITVRNDDVYIAGRFTGNVDFDGSVTVATKNYHGQYDMYVAKYNTNGNYQWAVNTGSTSCSGAMAYGVAIDNNNDILLSGSFCETTNFDVSGCATNEIKAIGSSDAFLAKYTPSSREISNNNLIAPAVIIFCGNGDPAVIKGTQPAGAAGNYKYQWQRSEDNTNFANITNATADSLDLGVISVSGYYRRVVTSGTCATLSESNSILFTVQTPTNAINNGITSTATLFCGPADPGQINGNLVSSATYQWQQSVNGTVFTDIRGATLNNYHPPVISATTYYRRIVYSALCLVDGLSNVVVIIINPPIANNKILPRSADFCDPADNPTLTGTPASSGGGVFTYQWQRAANDLNFTDVNGATTESYTPVATKGTFYYRRILLSSKCAAPLISDTASITYNNAPVTTIGPANPDAICAGGSIRLTATGGTSYSWLPVTGLDDPYSASPLASPTVTTTYLVVISNGSCNVNKTITVTVIPPLTATAGANQQVNAGNGVQLKGQSTGGGAVRYRWAPSIYLSNATIPNPIATPPQDITYTLTVTAEKDCFIATDEVKIKVIPKNVLSGVAIPTVFTPNGDGVNDTWIIPQLDRNPNCLVNVFSRNGALVFKSTGYTKPWDGMNSDKALPFGTYYYTIDLRDGSKISSGWIAIIK